MSTVTPALIEAALRDGYLIGEPVAKRRTNTAFVRATTGLLFTNGFSVNPDEAASLKKNSLEDAIAAAKKIVGEDRSWVPLFPDFPLHLDTNLELDIFLAQIRYYLTGERYDENASYRRGEETLSVKNLQKTLRPLEVMSAADYVRLVIGRMSGNETFSPKTVAALTAVVSDSAVFDDLAGEFVGAVAGIRNPVNFSYLPLQAGKFFLPEIKALVSAPATLDGLLRVVLNLYSCEETRSKNSVNRYAVATVNLDSRGAQGVRILPIPAAIRKLIVSRLGELSDGYRADSLLSNKRLWAKLLRSIHGFSYAKTPQAQRAVGIVYGNVEHQTLESTVESLIAEGSPVEAARLLSEHRYPLLLRRVSRLMSLTSTSNDAKAIAHMVIGGATSTHLPILLSARNGIANSGAGTSSVSRVAGQANTILTRGEDVLTDEQRELLLGAFAEAITANIQKRIPRPEGVQSLFYVETDTALSVVNHDTSVTDRSVPKGTRIPLDGLDDSAYLRAYVAWTGAFVDLDLGGGLLDSEGRVISMCSWNTNAKVDDLMVYSGDITAAPNGAVEYIDFNLSALLNTGETGARYGLITVNAYEGGNFSSIDAQAGVMLRNDQARGEYRDAKSSLVGFDLNAPSVQTLSFVIDFQDKVLIWADTSSGEQGSYTSLGSTYNAAVEPLARSIIFDKSLTYNEVIDLAAAAWDLPVDKTQIATPEDVRALLAL